MTATSQNCYFKKYGLTALKQYATIAQEMYWVGLETIQEAYSLRDRPTITFVGVVKPSHNELLPKPRNVKLLGNC